ncbi:MAG: TIM barrel protein [Verrucomicrobiota bacterium]
MKKQIQLILNGAFTCLLLALANPSYADSKSGNYEVGLSMYSLKALFKSGELTAFDYPAFAKEKFGITKIDVWDGAFPKGYKDDADFLPELKRRADAAGSEIFLVMTGTIKPSPDNDNETAKSGLKFKFAVDQAEILGAKYVRVFMRGDAKADEAENLRRFALALAPLADYAKSKDITIAIEPNRSAPLGSFYAKLVENMQHTHITLMPDFGKMRTTDFYQGTKDMLPYSTVISAKTHDINEDGSAEGFDYPRLMKIIKESDFKGIIAIEYEGKKPAPVEGVLATKKLIE